MRVYIKPRVRWVEIEGEALLVGSEVDEVEFRFGADVDDGWEENREFRLE